jgi:hypothetical protein
MPGATSEFRRERITSLRGVPPQIKIATECFLLFKLDGFERCVKAEALQHSTLE